MATRAGSTIEVRTIAATMLTDGDDDLDEERCPGVLVGVEAAQHQVVHREGDHRDGEGLDGPADRLGAAA